MEQVATVTERLSRASRQVGGVAPLILAGFAPGPRVSGDGLAWAGGSLLMAGAPSLCSQEAGQGVVYWGVVLKGVVSYGWCGLLGQGLQEAMAEAQESKQKHVGPFKAWNWHAITRTRRSPAKASHLPSPKSRCKGTLVTRAWMQKQPHPVNEAGHRPACFQHIPPPHRLHPGWSQGSWALVHTLPRLHAPISGLIFFTCGQGSFPVLQRPLRFCESRAFCRAARVGDGAGDTVDTKRRGRQASPLWLPNISAHGSARLNNGPHDVHILIPQTSDEGTLQGERDFAEVGPRWRDSPGSSEWLLKLENLFWLRSEKFYAAGFEDRRGAVGSPLQTGKGQGTESPLDFPERPGVTSSLIPGGDTLRAFATPSVQPKTRKTRDVLGGGRAGLGGQTQGLQRSRVTPQGHAHCQGVHKCCETESVFSPRILALECGAASAAMLSQTLPSASTQGTLFNENLKIKTCPLSLTPHHVQLPRPPAGINPTLHAVTAATLLRLAGHRSLSEGTTRTQARAIASRKDSHLLWGARPGQTLQGCLTATSGLTPDLGLDGGAGGLRPGCLERAHCLHRTSVQPGGWDCVQEEPGERQPSHLESRDTDASGPLGCLRTVWSTSVPSPGQCTIRSPHQLMNCGPSAFSAPFLFCMRTAFTRNGGLEATEPAGDGVRVQPGLLGTSGPPAASCEAEMQRPPGKTEQEGKTLQTYRLDREPGAERPSHPWPPVPLGWAHLPGQHRGHQPWVDLPTGGCNGPGAPP
ncbi:hypothetical protein Cadr_000017609 [Camelus dromedarius]|uniref:Uncharacterized protein n=1 Tax=Camelus dromedarius TaxID=9838 RepID=A0A5N4DHH1_CAMDR|nr:hypothetical protein Cadr_000017609 [Camelus dromedarius]